MKKRVGADNMPTSAVSGQFTALANLTATFAQPTEMDIVPNLVNTITGTVSYFKDAYGNPIDADWMVELMKGPITPADGTFMGVTTGDGSYSGTFHGDNTDAANAFPGSATGTFDAHFDNGHLAGAFGAHIVEEDEM